MRISLDWLLIVGPATALLMAACAGTEPTATPTPTPTSGPVPTLVPSPPAKETSESLVAPDPHSLPNAVAPGGLGSVKLPEDNAGIASLFELLPTAVAGLVRSSRIGEVGLSLHLAIYGNTGGQDCSPLFLQALDISTVDFFPSYWTADLFISFWSLGADWEVAAAGREGDLYWVQWNTTCSTASSPEESPVYSMSWGAAAIPWVFSALAGTPGELDALVAAFVAAASNFKP